MSRTSLPTAPDANSTGRPLRQPAALSPVLSLALSLLLGVAPQAGARPAPAKHAPAHKPDSAASSDNSASAPAHGDDRFSFYGLSPAAAGQTLAQAEAALGQPLKAEAAAALKATAAASAPAKNCLYRSVDRQPGVRYALAGDVVTRIETRDARYATVSGVHVGDPLDRAQKAYGKRLTVAPHPYFDKGRVLTVYSPDRRFALVMEANDQGRIITLRGGRLPDVTWLEGCS